MGCFYMTWNLTCMLIMIVLYLLGMVLVGALLAKKNNSAGDFYLGGRRLGPYVTAMSAEASDMSSWLLMGIPGLAYFCGISDAAWTCIGLVVGTYLNWLIVARRLRNYSERLGAITIPDFFRKRFHSDGKALQAIAAVLIIVFFVPYTASGFAGCGKLFSSLLGVDYIPAMLISALVIVLYTTLGGFLAASITDFIQSLFMTVALLAVLIFGTTIAGGMDRVMENARSVAGYLDMTKTANVVTGQSGPYSVLTIVSTMAWGLGYFGMPHILLRFMAISDANKLKVSRRVGTGWVAVSMFVAIAIGVVGFAASRAGAIQGFESASAAESVIVRLASFMSTHSVILALLAGAILAGILASTMSTADSQMLAAASSVSEDLVAGVFGAKLSDKKTMNIARLTVLGIAVLGALFALDANSSVFQIVSFAWAGFGAAFGPVMLTSLFWKRTNRCGALAGMIVGGAMVFVWKFLVRPMGGLLDIYELLPAFLCALAAIFLVSLVTAKPDEAVVKEFEAVRRA